MRWWWAMLAAFGLSLAAAIVDLRAEGGLQLPFSAVYMIGCGIGVLMLRGPGLVAAMVQPPVVLALSVLAAELLSAGGAGRSVAVGAAVQVTGQFPVMAATTGVTVVLGLVRLWRRRSLRLVSTAV